MQTNLQCKKADPCLLGDRKGEGLMDYKGAQGNFWE